jgi:acetyl esterase/lipase
LRGAVGCILVAVALLACMWCVVPGWNVATLVPTVAVPEWAPVALPVAWILGVLGTLAAPRGRVRRGVAVAGALAIVCAVVPVAEYLFDPTLPKVVSFGAMVHPRPPVVGDIERDVPFAPSYAGSSKPLLLDVYHAANVRRAPAAIEIHGGAWLYGDARSDERQNLLLAADGVTVIAIDYRLAPHAKFPAQRDDVDAAIRYVAAHAASFDIDPARIVAYRPQPIAFRGVAAFYAPTDLVLGATDPPRPDPVDIRRVLPPYVGPFTTENRKRYVEASPIMWASLHRVVPTFLIAGDRDEIVDVRQQRELAAILRRTPGDAVEAYELPWANHAFDSVPNGMGAQISEALLARWIRAVLSPTYAGSATSPVTTPTKISP